MPEKKARLQKILAEQGLGSRREMEKLIAAGRVTLNGVVAEVGQSATINDRIAVDGKPIHINSELTPKRKVILYHKIEGQICSRKDPEYENTVFDSLPRLRQGRWICVGRLDVNTLGLLLFTNDGELAHRLMHPSSEVEREYAVRVYGEVDATILKKLRKGVEIDGEMMHFSEIIDAGGEGKNHWYHVILKEGRYREVRRLWESQEIQVSRLIRVRFGHIVLPRSLPRGKWMYLPAEEVKHLAEVMGLETAASPAPATSKPRVTRRPTSKPKRTKK